MKLNCPEAQISVRTGFIVQGSTPTEEILNTVNRWKCICDKDINPIPGYFFAASKGELVNMNKHLPGVIICMNALLRQNATFCFYH
jgi:hypothetical protein